ncbi:hypothetical protein RYX36_022428 [Vicia faba]
MYSSTTTHCISGDNVVEIKHDWISEAVDNGSLCHVNLPPIHKRRRLVHKTAVQVGEPDRERIVDHEKICR